MNIASYASPIWWLWSVPLEWERWHAFVRESLQEAHQQILRALPWRQIHAPVQESTSLTISHVCVETTYLSVRPQTHASTKKVSTLPARSVTMPPISLAGICDSLLDQPPQEHILCVSAPRAPPTFYRDVLCSVSPALPQDILWKDLITKSTSALVNMGT